MAKDKDQDAAAETLIATPADLTLHVTKPTADQARWAKLVQQVLPHFGGRYSGMCLLEEGVMAEDDKQRHAERGCCEHPDPPGFIARPGDLILHLHGVAPTPSVNVPITCAFPDRPRDFAVWLERQLYEHVSNRLITDASAALDVGRRS